MRPQPASPAEVLFEKFKNNQDPLPEVYAAQMEWVRHYNNLIWSIGAIMMPFSFGGLAISYRTDHGDINFILMFSVAIGSMLLMLFWYLFSEWHRKLWSRNLFIANLIEAVWEYRDPPTLGSTFSDQPAAHFLPELLEKDHGRLLRRFIVLSCASLWGLRLLAALFIET